MNSMHTMDNENIIYGTSPTEITVCYKIITKLYIKFNVN